jgi:hypothetical protein
MRTFYVIYNPEDAYDTGCVEVFTSADAQDAAHELINAGRTGVEILTDIQYRANLNA